MNLAFSQMALDRFIDRFIPEDMAADGDTRQQVRMFLISHLFGPFIGNVVPITLYFLDPNPGYEVFVLAAAISSFWIFPFLLSHFRYNTLVLISVQNLNFCIFWSCYFYGGVSSPTVPWVMTIPLLSFFYVGPSPAIRLALIGLFAVNFALFFQLSHLHGSFPTDVPESSLHGFGIVSTIATSLYVMMMALYYARIRESGVELERESKGHLATAAELRRAVAQAERAGAAKSEFLARMSHELRTPLNAIIGYSQLLIEDATEAGDTEEIGDLQKIRNSGEHLLRLINEVLDLSKIEAGRMELSTEECDVAGVLSDVVERHRDAAVANANEMVLRLSPDLGRAEWDQAKTAQALSQLVENAAKFTENGRVTVSAERVTGENGDEIMVAVEDTGIGIARDLLPVLFDKFTVGGDVTTSKYGGTGLGLALAQRLAHLMEGDISVTSQLGVGSRFVLRLPVRPAQPAAALQGMPGANLASDQPSPPGRQRAA